MFSPHLPPRETRPVAVESAVGPLYPTRPARAAYRGQFLDVVVGRAERGQPDLLRELRERRVGEQRHVPQKLVTYVRLGRVQRPAMVPDVLRGVEHPERQPGQEVPGRQQSADRPQREPGTVCGTVTARKYPRCNAARRGCPVGRRNRPNAATVRSGFRFDTRPPRKCIFPAPPPPHRNFEIEPFDCVLREAYLIGGEAKGEGHGPRTENV